MAQSRKTESVGVRQVAVSVAVTIVAFALAYLAIWFTRENGRVAAIWPVNALVLVLLLGGDRKNWRGVLAGLFVGNLSANLVTGDQLIRGALLAATNVAEVAIVLLAMARTRLRVNRLSTIVRFLIFAGLACFASTVAASLILWATGSGLSPESAAIWFAADSLGLAIFAPVGLVLIQGTAKPLFARSQARMTLSLLAIMAAITGGVFYQSSYPLLFLIVIVLVLVGFRLGLAGAALAILTVAAISIPMTLSGQGPAALIEDALAVRVFLLQVFLAALTLMGLLVGAVEADRRALIARLSAAKARLEGRAEHNRRLLEQARLSETMSEVGYWTLEPATGSVFWSAQVYRIHGVDPADYQPGLNDALEFYLPDDRARISGLIAEGVASAKGWSFDATLTRRSDDSPRQVQSLAECEVDASGAVTRIFGVFKDMTDERQAQGAIAENERKYRLLADNSSDMISIFKTTGELTFISPASVAVLGYSPDEMLGRNVLDMIHEEDKPSLRALFQTLFRRGPEAASPPTQYRGLHRDGRWVWLEGRPKVFFDEAGHPNAVQDVVRDVTARKMLEFELAEARQQAEAATRAKATFLATMSHEIRTPLNGVLGFAELLNATPLNVDQTLYVERIRTAGRGLAKLIEDILDHSRIEAGKLSIQDHAFALRPLIEEIAALIESGMARKPIRFEVLVGDAVAPRLRGDDMRIRQVLLNLMGNAAKFTDEGYITLRADIDAGRLVLSVADTGPGIDEAHMADLFESFTQVDGSVTRRFGGSGLGLSISRSLARLMDGELALESEPGVGTTARLTLPYRPDMDADLAKSPTSTITHSPTARRLTVMIVDDGAMNRELIEIALCVAGHASTSFENATDAIDALKAGRAFDVVLMDVQMPGMDGLAATRAIRGLDQKTADIPIVALTANVLPDQIMACRDAGMDEHVAKPVDLDALMAVLDRVQGRKTRAEQSSASPSEAPTSLDALTCRYVEHVSGLPTEIDRLMRAGAAGDVARMAHSVAGTAGSFGFPQLSDAAFALEAAAKRGDSTRKLKTELQQAASAFKVTAQTVGHLEIDSRVSSSRKARLD